jgi:sugar (pentulose or hexulose) kinase
MNNFNKTRAVLCVDIGTSSLKAALICIEGDSLTPVGSSPLLAFARADYAGGAGGDDQMPLANGTNAASTGSPALSSAASADGLTGRRLRAADWEAAFFRAAKELFEARIPAAQPDVFVQAVCISGNGPTLVAVDDRGRELAVLHWYDEAPRIAGCGSFFLPHVAFFKDRHPDDYAATRIFLSCHEWLSWRLGAAQITSLPAAAYEPYYWDAAQCAALSLDAQKFAPFAPLGTVIGEVSAAAAETCLIATGKNQLAAGTPIVSAGPDFIMALLGAGVTRPSRVLDRAGSSEGINVCVAEKPDFSALDEKIRCRLRLLPQALSGLWNVSVVLPESGSIFDRYRAEHNELDKSHDETLKGLLPASLRDIPLDDPRGMAEAIKKIPVADLQEQSAPELQAMLLGLAESLAVLAAAGYPVHEMRLSGGQAKSRLWNVIKAHFLGCAMLVPHIKDGELTADAACAMTALGIAPSLEAACDQLVVIEEIIC